MNLYLPGFLMDLAGIEPASESLSLAASPITVADLTFPWRHAHRQAYCFSSFMIHLPGQSLPGKVSHMVDARSLKCECIRASSLKVLHIDYYPKNRGEYSSKYVAFFTKLYYNHSCKKNLPFKNFFYINPLFNYLYSP